MIDSIHVRIDAPPAIASARAPIPGETPTPAEALLSTISHHCPLCGETFDWQPFKAHAPACAKAYNEAHAGEQS